MPPPYVRTIRDEIYYEYAKLISRSALGNINYKFVSDRFKKLQSGEITPSGTLREWEREQSLPKVCVYCGAGSGLTTDHLIPRNRGGEDSPDNAVLACPSCNASKGDRGVFEWLGLEKKDEIHRLVAGKYLKQLYALHEKAGTLAVAKEDLKRLCDRCGASEACRRWATVGKLTCFCLESCLPR